MTHPRSDSQAGAQARLAAKLGFPTPTMTQVPPPGRLNKTSVPWGVLVADQASYCFLELPQ